jgi:hypothetical protein
MADIPWDELMDAAGDSDFAPIPQSDYNVKIVETEATTSSTSKPMWKIVAEVIGGPHEGRKLWTQQTLTMDNPNALNMFFRQMAAAGLTAEFFKTKPSNQLIADALLGRTFRAKVIISEYQGSPRNEIKNWSPAAGGMGAPGGPPPPPAAGGAPGGPPPPPAASAPPPPPPAASAPPAAATPPPAATTPPPAAATPPPAAATPPPAEQAPPAAEPTPAAPAAEQQPEPAGVGAGGGDPWVVQPRETGSTEPPPF